MFFGVYIPITSLVFKENRKTKDLLLIDAANEFEKEKNQDNLTNKNINKIIETYQESGKLQRTFKIHIFSRDVKNHIRKIWRYYEESFRRKLNL